MLRLGGVVLQVTGGKMGGNVGFLLKYVGGFSGQAGSSDAQNGAPPSDATSHRCSVDPDQNCGAGRASSRGIEQHQTVHGACLQNPWNYILMKTGSKEWK